jgi:hypothetical protein
MQATPLFRERCAPATGAAHGNERSRSDVRRLMRHPPSLLLAAAVFAAVLSGFGWMWMRYGQPMPLMASAAATVETIAR